MPPHAGCFRDDQIFDASDLQRDKVPIPRRCDAEVKGDGQRVGRLSQSARRLVDDVDRDLQFGMPQPRVGKSWASGPAKAGAEQFNDQRPRPLRRIPRCNRQTMIAGVQPDCGSAAQDWVWRAQWLARCSLREQLLRSDEVPSPGRAIDRTLHLVSLHMWRIACKSQIFEGQEKSSRAVACQDIAVAISQLSKPRKDGNPRSAPRNSFLLRTPSRQLNMSSVVASDAASEVGSGGCRVLADFSALPVKSSIGYSECRSGAHAVWPNAVASRGCEPR